MSDEHEFCWALKIKGPNRTTLLTYNKYVLVSGRVERRHEPDKSLVGAAHI
jgi:hypothetical protein